MIMNLGVITNIFNTNEATLPIKIALKQTKFRCDSHFIDAIIWVYETL